MSEERETYTSGPVTLNVNAYDLAHLRHAQTIGLLEEIKALLAELVTLTRVVYRMTEQPPSA